MSGPKVEVVYDGSFFTLPDRYKDRVAPGRLAGSPGDNLVEFAGRLCYDAFPPERPGRESPDYHANVRKLRHHSLHAHLVDTYAADGSPEEVAALTAALHCRPGVWVTDVGPDGLRFAASLRALIEWSDHGPIVDTAARFADRVRAASAAALKACAASAAARYRLAAADLPVPHGEVAKIDVRPDSALYDKEAWVSLYIEGVSRDVLQELVRHHWQTNPSVRSTRYVDEGTSAQIVHPELAALREDDPLRKEALALFGAAKLVYQKVFAGLKFGCGVADKSARGAARSCLPGATETRMVFSASLFQWRHILALRKNEATGAVDPEVKRLADLVAQALARFLR